MGCYTHGTFPLILIQSDGFPPSPGQLWRTAKVLKNCQSERRNLTIVNCK